jgi:hypothetical protein
MTQLIFARKSMVWYCVVMKLSAIQFIWNFNILPDTITSGFLFVRQWFFVNITYIYETPIVDTVKMLWMPIHVMIRFFTFQRGSWPSVLHAGGLQVWLYALNKTRGSLSWSTSCFLCLFLARYRWGCMLWVRGSLSWSTSSFLCVLASVFWSELQVSHYRWIYYTYWYHVISYKFRGNNVQIILPKELWQHVQILCVYPPTLFTQRKRWI